MLTDPNFDFKNVLVNALTLTTTVIINQLKIMDIY